MIVEGFFTLHDMTFKYRYTESNHLVRGYRYQVLATNTATSEWLQDDRHDEEAHRYLFDLVVAPRRKEKVSQ